MGTRKEGGIDDPFALNDPPDTRTRVTLDVGELALVREGLDVLRQIAGSASGTARDSARVPVAAPLHAAPEALRDGVPQSIAQSLARIEHHLDWPPFTLGFSLICAALFHACLTNHDITVKLAPPPAEATAKP